MIFANVEFQSRCVLVWGHDEVVMIDGHLRHQLKIVGVTYQLTKNIKQLKAVLGWCTKF